jgi:hypothetical protein
MASNDERCPCCRHIEDVADAIAIVGDLGPTLMEMYDVRVAAVQQMDIHLTRHGVSPDDMDHPLNVAMMQAQTEIHALHILVRASGVMAGIPDVADVNWEDAAAAFHSDTDFSQGSTAAPVDKTKH